MNGKYLKMYDKIILGIDPGTNIMGYGVIGIKSNKPTMLAMNVVRLKNISDAYMKLENIYTTVQSLVEDYLPDEMAIEAQFYGKNVQSMLKLGRAQGVAIAAALSRQVPIKEYEPRKVKLAITGRGSAGKEQVKEMVMRLLNIPGPLGDVALDATDALAIALCHFYESSRPVSTSRTKSWKDFVAQHPEKIKKR